MHHGSKTLDPQSVASVATEDQKHDLFALQVVSSRHTHRHSFMHKCMYQSMHIYLVLDFNIFYFLLFFLNYDKVQFSAHCCTILKKTKMESLHV